MFPQRLAIGDRPSFRSSTVPPFPLLPGLRSGRMAGQLPARALSPRFLPGRAPGFPAPVRWTLEEWRALGGHGRAIGLVHLGPAGSSLTQTDERYVRTGERPGHRQDARFRPASETWVGPMPRPFTGLACLSQGLLIAARLCRLPSVEWTPTAPARYALRVRKAVVPPGQ